MPKIQRLLPLAGFAIILCGTSVWGQTKIMHGDIPFPFHVGDKHFTAEHYDVIIDVPFTGGFTVRSSNNRDGDAFGFFLVDRRQDSSALQSKLVFTKYNTGEYFLSEIWHPWLSNSMKLPQSKHEVVTSKLVTELRPEKVVIWAAVRLP